MLGGGTVHDRMDVDAEVARRVRIPDGPIKIAGCEQILPKAKMT